MAAKSTHFRVGNGDMTLIKLDSGRCILIDINIRSAADDTQDSTPDVAGARYAEEAGVWNAIRPYLEAMTANA